MNPTEYIGLLLLKKMLPDDVKQPILSVDKEDLDEVQLLAKVDLKKIIVVHPGRGWPSKTFPSEWYDKIIDGLVKAGRHVAVVGKWMNEDQGTVPVTIKDGVIDLRNLLTLGGSFALLSKACVLISNDSSPIHIASAFDNHIILIPSCKHPDHVLHVRKGHRYHKAVALFKKLTCDTVDSTPTMIHDMSTIDKVVGDIYDYIPDPEQVVEEALRRSAEFY
jgi:ADP-heptose:LPS heptosyltransferase